MKQTSCLFFLAFLALSAAHAATTKDVFGTGPKYNDYWEEEKEWKELDVEPPAFPVETNLKAIYVSAVATNQYLIDINSISVGSDKVVRYTLVVRTPGGAENISFEGMSCEKGQWKTYATGRRTAEGGMWAKARIQEWRVIENKPVNRHHAELAKSYFCPIGNTIFTDEEGKNAIRRGGHPDVPGNH